MKKFWRGLFFVAAIALVLMPSMHAEAKKGETLHQGIWIGPVNVSGMTQAQAQAAVEDAVENSMNATITLQCVGEHSVTVTPQQFGVTWANADIIKDAAAIGKKGDIVSRYKEMKDLQYENKVLPITYECDKELITAIIEEKCDGYNEEAKDVSLVRENGVFKTVGGKAGQILDNEAAKTQIYEYLTTKWDGTDVTLELPIIVDEPKGSEEELLAVKDILGSYTTSYKTSSADRSANVSNGCRLVNGTTLYPGDTFSMYDAIKPFTVENGYRMAGSYLNGMVVDSLGGGICQVSTTLYNAVLFSELEIVERNNHSMIVSYVPASADAAIAESSGKDFKFKNNSEYPIYIEGITTGDKHITFNIYGVETRPANRKVTFQSEILETITPTSENIIQSASQPVGFANVQSAHIGYKARLWKIVTVDGKEESREIVNKSNYKMVPRTVTVGIATDNPEAYNQIQAAIATGSIDQVKAVSDAWAAANAAAANAAAQVPAE